MRTQPTYDRSQEESPRRISTVLRTPLNAIRIDSPSPCRSGLHQETKQDRGKREMTVKPYYHRNMYLSRLRYHRKLTIWVSILIESKRCARVLDENLSIPNACNTEFQWVLSDGPWPWRS
jgi:hypothetical protein